MTHMDVRRTAGGLQLTFIPPGWAMRVRYEDAAALATALMTDQPYCFPAGASGEVIIGYLPHQPQSDEGLFVRVQGDVSDPDVTAEVCFALDDWHATGEVIRAHLPDQLPPLPGDVNTPWTPHL